jgi:glycosidase
LAPLPPTASPAHPLYREIATLARLRRATPALWGGATRLRAYSDKPGLFAVSRFDPKTGAEVLLAFNTSDQPLTAAVAVEPNASSFTTLAGACPATVTAPGTASISLPAFGYAICAASPAPSPKDKHP